MNKKQLRIPLKMQLYQINYKFKEKYAIRLKSIINRDGQNLNKNKFKILYRPNVTDKCTDQNLQTNKETKNRKNIS